MPDPDPLAPIQLSGDRLPIAEFALRKQKDGSDLAQPLNREMATIAIKHSESADKELPEID